MNFDKGSVVIAVLQNPREKVFGVLNEINSAGLSIRGIDLNYFDEWTVAIKNGEPQLPMQDNFFPMWRIERVTIDVGAEGLPSMSELFQKKTGQFIDEFAKI
ncbi:MAG: hypothetical protein HKN33_15405 [Pyrinomonadaceae bacterium]|nr:hypothetical protein [Pyrinomonadaceae bacterium]